MIEQLLIGGASRHAKDIIATINSELVKIVLFDDITIPKPLIFLNNFSIINDIEKARIYFKTNPYFVIGIGGTKSRRDLYNKLISVGGLVKQ
ncbi:MAG: hypothetical protein IPG60_16530 [Bacteroidetes bacterium]|nr:hypothetical protein [Bacteroidota bacterium]